jgi:hypothetical protein
MSVTMNMHFESEVVSLKAETWRAPEIPRTAIVVAVTFEMLDMIALRYREAF